jgi:2-polyprenyl-3-methyl-5-hydroxy-6-metoxy-1,4-benzoquinol methylase
VRCLGCGFVYVNPIETLESLVLNGAVLDGRPTRLLKSADAVDILGSWEEPIINKYLAEEPAKRVNASAVVRSLNELAPGRGKLLDIGCFCGIFLDEAAKEGWDCTGLEPLVMPAIHARSAYGLSVVTDTLRDGLFEPDSYDVVTAFQVLEHMVDVAGELAKISRILKPGGLFVAEVPNIDTLGVKLLGRRHRHFVMDHVNFFSARTLAMFMERYGFRVIGHHYPKRVVSCGHLGWWAEEAIGKGVGKAVRKVSDYLRLNKRMVSIGIGDIITMDARKES